MGRRMLKGDLETLKYGKAVGIGGRIAGAYLSLQSKNAINFFQKISVTMPRIAENELGLYSRGTIGKTGKVKFAAIGDASKHLLRPRGNKGCIFDPVGKVSMEVEEYSVCPVKYNGRICPDQFWGTCFEEFMGTGNDITDLYATPETRKLVDALLMSIFESLGNSFYMLAWFAAHPLVEYANTNNTFKVDVEEFESFYAQQALAYGGWMTIIDGFKSQGLPNYNIPIFDQDIDANGVFIGDVGRPAGLFERLVKGSTPVMKQLNSTKFKVQGGRTRMKSPILVSDAIFEAYKTELLTDFPHLAETFYYKLNGEYCKELGCIGNEMQDHILKWDGHFVINYEAWNEFYHIVGQTPYIAMMVVPGVLGMAYDVVDLAGQQESGLGLIVEQRLGLGDDEMGQIRMSTHFDMGMGIVNRDLVTYAGEVIPVIE